jgi:hypothetical protein
MKSKRLLILFLGLSFIFGCNATNENEMNWSYQEDLNFVEKSIAEYEGLQDVAVGNLKYVVNTKSFEQFAAYIEKQANFTGTIYYELNVNESHFLIALLTPKDSTIDSIVFNGESVSHHQNMITSLKSAIQPVLQKDIIISDGYLMLRVDIENGMVLNRFVNVVDELSDKPLVSRVDFIVK